MFFTFPDVTVVYRVEMVKLLFGRRGVILKKTL